MPSPEFLFALLIAVTGFAFSGERALYRVREAQRRYRVAMTKKSQYVGRVRKAARETLGLKRELRQLDLARADLLKSCRRLEQDIKAASRPENRVFVLDERRMPQDQAWIATVQAAAEAAPGRQLQAWEGARRFLVWGVDAEVARTKVTKRYPAPEGFTLTTLVPRPKRTAPASPDAGPV